MTTSALSQLTVVDLSWGFTGAIISMTLADYGAEVIKVEPPGGDLLRSHPAFPMWQRGKKSVVLELKRQADRDRVRQLASGADVVVETFRPGVAERMGLDYATLCQKNPSLVLASVTAFGTKGPLAHVKGYEALAIAKIGGFGTDSTAPRPGPAFTPVAWAGYSAAQTALQGILAALYVRERTGQGQHVETTLTQGLVAQDPWNQFIIWLAKKYPEAYTVTAAVPKEGTPLTEYIYRLLVAMTKDGRWLQFSQTSPHLWQAMLKSLDLEWIASDETFKHAPAFETYEDSVRFWEVLLNIIRSRTWAEWDEHFRAHPNVGAELFRTAEEGMAHPQVLHNGHVMEMDNPRLGTVRQLAPFARMLETPANINGPAPELGEHTDAVLQAVDSGWWKPSPTKGTGELPAHALEGVTVVELGLFYASPFGVTCLADLGARVIKLEPMRGDDIRYAMPIPETGAVKVLQGKESVAIDLDTPHGQEIAHKIIAQADLVMMSFRGGVASRLRVDYETLKSINPNLVYLNAPGYGIDGPFARKPAYAPTIGAAIGSAMTQVGPGLFAEDPETVSIEEIKATSVRLRAAASGPGNADGVSSLTVGTALLLGLLARERTGIAQEMLTSMLGSTAYTNSAEMVQYEGKPVTPGLDDGLYGMGALYRVYETSDGWVCLACPQDNEWTSLCDAVAKRTNGSFDLAGDRRFATSTSRHKHNAALADVLGQIFKTRTAQEWERLLAENDVGCVEVSDQPMYHFAMHDAVMVENGFLSEVDHPTFGPHPRLAPLVRLSKTPGLARAGNVVGQHTDAVLREFGYTDGTIRELEAAGVIRRSG